MGFLLFAAWPALAQDARFGSSEWGARSRDRGGAPAEVEGSAHVDAAPWVEASVDRAAQVDTTPLWYALGGGVVTFLLLGVLWVSRSRAAGVSEAERPALVDVALVSIALRGEARERMLKLLPPLARGLGHARARHAALAEVVGALRAAKDAWVFGRVVDHLPRAVGPARRDLDRHASELRARYRHAHQRFDAASPTHDEDAFVVVSLVVAAEGTIEDARTVSTERLDALLRRLLEIPCERLVALEVTWSPTGARERLGRAELEVVFPELVPLADPPGERVTCGSCGAVSAGALASCPACGAARPPTASAPGPVAEAARHEVKEALRARVRGERDPRTSSPFTDGRRGRSRGGRRDERDADA